MTDTRPQLHKKIYEKINKVVQNIKSNVEENHVDGEIQLLGYLRNGNGAKIQVSGLEYLDAEDIESWIDTCNSTGASHVNYIANFGDGNVTLDVEYKRPSNTNQYCEWLKYPIILASLSLILQFL